MRLERDYQSALIQKIRRMYPNAIILKNDANYLQGVPDLSIFHGPNYAMLETKQSSSASRQANQEWYISLFQSWAYGAFIDPSNEKDILNELQEALQL